MNEDTIDTLNRYKSFFKNLSHLSFIAINQGDSYSGNLVIKEYNKRISSGLPEIIRGNVTALKGMEVKEFFKILFPDHEKMISEYWDAVCFIFENFEASNLDKASLPSYNEIDMSLEGANGEKHFFLRSTAVRGLKTSLSIPGISGEVFLELFSIPHVTDAGELIGMQVLLPNIKLTRNLKLLRQANLNAIAKVMARNMSHNIGSHVLSRLVHPKSIDIGTVISEKNLDYASVKEETKGADKKRRIEEKLNRLTADYWTVHSELKSNEVFRLEIEQFLGEQAHKAYYNDLLSYFFSYLKTRQDLLADVVTGVPQVQSSKWFMDEIMTGIDSNRLLLNRISGVEDFYYKFEFKGLVCKCLEKCNSCKEKRDIQVAVANDIVGQHAFYIILENIIRNTAKHGQKNSPNTAEKEHIFSIMVQESTTDTSYYQVTVYDDMIVQGHSYLKLRKEKRPSEISEQPIDFQPDNENIIEIEERHQHYYLQRLDYEVFYAGSAPDENNKNTYDFYRISNIDRLVIHQNIWINEPIVNLDTLDLRQGALGLIEMEVCAAYLRRVPIEAIEIKEFKLRFDTGEVERFRRAVRQGREKLQLLRALKMNEDKEKQSGVLGYRFYLPKPKEILILDEKGILWEAAKNTGTPEDKFTLFKHLESNGILLLNAKEDYLEDEWKHWRFNPDSVYQHAIMLVVTDNDASQNNEERHIDRDYNDPKFPERKITFSACQSLFNAFKKKYEKRIATVEKAAKRKGRKANWTGYDIFFDILNHPEESIVEIWRAYIWKKFERKQLAPDPEGIVYFRKILNDLPFNKLHTPKFDHHGKAYTVWSEDWYRGRKIGNCNEIFESKFKDYYVERITAPDKADNLLLKLRYLDASLSNILIIDERIQEQAFSRTYKLQGGPELTLARIWDHVNVYIPSAKELNLNVKTFSPDYKDSIVKITRAQFGKDSFRQCKGIDFIIIHLGVVEKILEQTKGKSKDNTGDIIAFMNDISVHGAQKAKVILTSGRAPTNLSGNLSFLSYSVISQYTIEYRFKLLLHEVLNAARPKIQQK